MNDAPRNLGKYEVLERLGGGGMAEVFLGRSTGHEGFAKLVAIKRVLPEHASGSFMEMMVDEALIASNLSHINISQIYDLVRADDTCFIVMEYIQGVSLNRVLGRLARKGRPMPPAMAVFLLRQVCAGLEYAHNQTDSQGRPLKIIHRDVSPDNVMVSFEGEVKLIDFGIAKAARRLHATQVGQIKGKFAYMSPEQARGGELDHRSDIFSAGLMLYEFLTLSNPFECTEALIQAVTKDEVPPPSAVVPGLPIALDGICITALALNPRDRYAGAGEMERDLDLFQRDNPFTRRELAARITESFKSERTAMERLVEATCAGGGATVSTVAESLPPRNNVAPDLAETLLQPQGDEAPDRAETLLLLREDEAPAGAETLLLQRNDEAPAGGETLLLQRDDKAPVETVLVPRTGVNSAPPSATQRSKGASRRRTRIRAALIVVLATTLGGAAATVVFSLAMCDTTLPAAAPVASRKPGTDGGPPQGQQPTRVLTVAQPPASAARDGAGGEETTDSSVSTAAPDASPGAGHRIKAVRLRPPGRTRRPRQPSRPRRSSRPTGQAWITVVTMDGTQQIWANVSLDGQSIGRSMIYRKKIKAGRHVVVVQRSGYLVTRQTIQLKANQERRVLLKLRRSTRDR
jgi:serine/threonine protein kinase